MNRFLRSKLIQTLAALVIIAIAIIIPLSGTIFHSHAQSTSIFTEFPVPTSNRNPNGITTGPDGNLWFNETGGNKIGKMTPSGTFTEYPVPTSNSGLENITTGPDGNLWFTEANGNQIGRITPSGIIAEFPIPTSGSYPEDITVGPDGNLWFTEYFGNQIGRITPNGSITEFPLPNGNSNPNYITTGPDGNLWFTEYGTNLIGQITTSGSITEFPIPTSGSNPRGITTGPDGNLWFTEVTGNQIGQITPSGTITEFPVPTSGSRPWVIIAGPDGNLWFTEFFSVNVGRITPSGSVTEFPLPNGGGPDGITAGPLNSVWFTEWSGDQIGQANLSNTTPTPIPSPSPSPTTTPTVAVSPNPVPAGKPVIVTGSGWTPGDVIDISLSTSASVLTKATVAGDRTFSASFTVPQNAATVTQFVNAKDETTGQTAQASLTVIRRKLFILLQGINSQLTATDIQNNPAGTTLGSVGSILENTFPDAQFFDYSYAGSQMDGTPQPYSCAPTFTNPIVKDIQLLNTQIAHAVGNNQSTDIYLIGHSLGGVVEFGYLSLLEDHLNRISLPIGAQLKAVVTLDSPLGGVRGGRYEYFSKYIATNYLIPHSKAKIIPNYPCNGLVGTKTPLTTIDDLVKIYDSSTNGGTTLPDDPGNDPLGAQSSIEAISGVNLPPQRPFLPTNNSLALRAHTDLGTSVLSVGNTGDYLWNPAPCSPFFVPLSPALAIIIGTIPGFIDTQFLEDQGNSSGLYGRFFNTAQFCDAATLTNGLNHGDVLVNTDVLKGLVHFLAPIGATPDPLAINPYQP